MGPWVDPRMCRSAAAQDAAQLQTAMEPRASPRMGYIPFVNKATMVQLQWSRGRTHGWDTTRGSRKHRTRRCNGAMSEPTDGTAQCCTLGDHNTSCNRAVGIPTDETDLAREILLPFHAAIEPWANPRMGPHLRMTCRTTARRFNGAMGEPMDETTADHLTQQTT